MTHRALAALLLLGGCAQSGASTFPSLAPRPIEARGDAIDATPLPPPAPADATLIATLARLRREAANGDAAFASALPATERAVRAASGAAASSEAWVAAQAALSGLDAARSPTAVALGEIDQIFIALANGSSADAAVGGVEEASTARGEIEALHNAQIERLQALQASLRTP